jgi:hypothetical protein
MRRRPLALRGRRRQEFFGMLLNTCLVLSGRVLDHLREIDLVSFPHAKVL